MLKRDKRVSDFEQFVEIESNELEAQRIERERKKYFDEHPFERIVIIVSMLIISVVAYFLTTWLTNVLISMF